MDRDDNDQQMFEAQVMQELHEQEARQNLPSANESQTDFLDEIPF